MDDGDLIAVADQFGDGFGALVQQLGIFQRRATEFDHKSSFQSPSWPDHRPSCLQQAFGFGPAAHQVHILYRLSGCALEQVVEAGDDHASPAVAGELEADVADSWC